MQIAQTKHISDTNSLLSYRAPTDKASPNKCHYTFTASDRPFGPHFSGKESRPRSAADESTLWPSLSGEGQLDSLRLGRIASLDSHFTGKESLPHFHLSKKLDSLFSVVSCLSTTRCGFTCFGGQMQRTQVSRAVTYLGRTYIQDCVL